MSLLLNLLTTTAMLAHSLLGCCWHHGHSHPCSGSRPAATHQPSTEDPGSCCSRSERDHAGGRPHRVCEVAHDEGHLCDEPTCAFVKSPEPQSVGAPAASVAGATPPRAAQSARQAVLYAAVEARRPVPRSAAALRAVLGTWLI